MAVDSYLQVCFYEGMSLESPKKPKLYWEQTGFEPLSSSDIQEIGVGSSPGGWISQDQPHPPRYKMTESVQERGLLRCQEGWLVQLQTSMLQSNW